jgi:DNA polymerase-3 subunit alpha
MVLKVNARACDETLIGDLKSVLEHFPGEAEVMLEMETSAGPRRLRFGAGYRVSPSVALRAEIDHLLGPDALVA